MRSWLAGLLLIAADPALACKCAVVSYDDAVASVPYVFEGRIARIETEGTTQITTMSISRVIKGPLRGIIKVKTDTESASCGYDFRGAEKRVTVGGDLAGPMFSVHRCTMYNLNR